MTTAKTEVAEPRPSTWTLIRLCAGQERVLAVRSRWVQLFAAVFALLAIGVAGSGYVLSGGHGVQDFARTAVSLVQLVLLVIPMTALTIGVLSLTLERGQAEMLFAQPVSRRVILLGKLLGLFEALAAAQAIGFGAAGLLIVNQAGEEGSSAFIGLVIASLILTAIFLALAALIAAGEVGRPRGRGLAIALVVWVAMVVVYDLVTLGTASLLPSKLASQLLIAAAVINPVDAVRTGTLLAIEGAAAFGSASLAFLRASHGTLGATLLILASTVVWTVAPISLALRRLARRDL
jgi:Cu-processing system permease protein